MLGTDFRELVLVDRSALDLAGDPLLPWIRWWMDEPERTPLSINEWFHEGHLPGVHLWTPPLAGGPDCSRTNCTIQVEETWTGLPCVCLPTSNVLGGVATKV